MDLDLGRALHDAARSGTAHRPAIDAVTVVQRVRRRRAVRHAVEGTVVRLLDLLGLPVPEGLAEAG